MPPPKKNPKTLQKADFNDESEQNLKKEQKLPDLVDPKGHQNRVKLRKWPKFPIFGPFFPRIFWFLAPNNQLKSALFDKNQI